MLERNAQKTERFIEERHGHEMLGAHANDKLPERIATLDHKIESLLIEKKILEEALRYGLEKSLKNAITEKHEHEVLHALEK